MSDAPHLTVLERHISPDKSLVLIAGVGKDGMQVVGFEGGDWHTHPELIADWLGVLESQAIRCFIDRVIADEIPIITSVDGGKTFEPKPSIDVAGDLDYYGRGNCIVRYWSGKLHHLQ